MQLDILVYKLTPCLVEVATEDDISGLSEKGWLFNWSDDSLKKTNIYKLLIKGDDHIQGLISAEVVRGAVYIHLVESAPHNLEENKQYEGVGGHLFAIAIKLSIANGFGGYVFFDAKNIKLVEHYAERLGATRVPVRIHDYRMEILEDVAPKIISKYTLEGDLNVE